jgi:hypothetical protein
MFGNHNYNKAVKLAAKKSKELGKKCAVFPSEDEPGKFTIGVPIKATTVGELIESLKAKEEPK